MIDPPVSSSSNSNDEFVGLLMQHRHALYAFIAKQLVNPVDAEDVFQKTSLVLWRKMDQFDSDGSFFHWACGIAFNEVRNFLKSQRRSRLHFDDELVQLLAEESEAECDATQTRLKALRECMAMLSLRQQDIIRLSYEGSRTISEVAAATDRNRDALYKQLARLRTRLHNCIEAKIGAGGAA